MVCLFIGVVPSPLDVGRTVELDDVDKLDKEETVEIKISEKYLKQLISRLFQVLRPGGSLTVVVVSLYS